MATINDTLGNPQAFYREICAGLQQLGISAESFPISHLAFRTRTFREYLQVRGALEAHASACQENVFNDRPIAKIQLSGAIELSPDVNCDLIELIPPFHKSIYPMGFEHAGFVLDDRFDGFGKQYRAALNGQQYHSDVCAPYVVRFANYTHAKFYRYSMAEVCRREGHALDGFVRADWAPVDLDAGPYEDLAND